MLIPMALWEPIRRGEVTLAFRSWKRPTVKAGGSLLAAGGQLAIDAVEAIDPDRITDADARRAGEPDADAVRATLRPGDDRTTYRIAFRWAGPDPREALRDDADLDADELAALLDRLARLDQRSPTGPWVRSVLQVIADHPATVSTDLAERVGDERARFKTRVRRLKGLGLTESLGTGYRLSPRGGVVLDALASIGG